MSFPDVIKEFEDLLRMKNDINQLTMSFLEQFVVLHDRASDAIELN